MSELATITSLGFTIFSTYSGEGVSAARRDLNQLNRDLDSNTAQLQRSSKSFFSLSTAAMTLGPALTPVGGAALAGAAAFTTMAAAGLGAAGIFGLAVVASLRNLKKNNDEVAKSVKGLKTSFNEWGQSMSPLIKGPVVTFVNALSGSFRKLTPAVVAMVPVATQVANAFKHWTDNNLQGWVSWISATGRPILENFITTGKNLGRVFGDMLRAFGPMAISMSEGLAKVSAHLKGWADGGGFTRFIDSIRANGPQIRAFFDALGQAVRNIAVAMAGLGSPMLTVTTLLLRIVASMPPGLIQAIAIAILVWRSAMLAYAAATTIATAAQIAYMLVTTSAGVLMLASAASILIVVAAVAALGVGIFMLVTHWSAAWNGIKLAFETVYNFLTHGLGQLVLLILGVPGALIYLSAHWQAVWNGIKLAAEVIWGALKVAWQATINGLITAWQVVSAALVASWNAVWNAMSIAVRAIWTALQIAWSAFIGAMAIVWQTVSAALVASWNAVWNGMSVAAHAIWTALQAAWSAFITALHTIWATVSAALQASWNAVWNAMSAAARAVWSALQAAWNAFWAAMRAAATAALNALKSAWDAAWNAMKAAAQAVWNAIRSAFTAFWNAMKSAAQAALNALKSAWSAAWNAIKTAGQSVWNAIRSLFTTFWNAMKTAATNGVNAMKKTFSDAWNSIKTTAKSGWHEIGKIIAGGVNAAIDVLNGIIKGWDAVVSAVGLDSLKVSAVGHVSFNFAEGGMVPDAAFHKGGMSSLARSNGRKLKGARTDLSRGGSLAGYSPGRDTVPAILSPGEGVLVPEAVRALGGPRFIYQANHHFSGGRAKSPYFPGYAQGGMVGGLAAMLQGGGIIQPIPGSGSSPTAPGGPNDPNKPNPPGKPGQTGPGSTTVPAPGQTPTTGSTAGDLANILGKGAQTILEGIIKGALGLAGGTTGVVGSVVGGAAGALKGIVGSSVGSLLLGFIGKDAIEGSFKIFDTFSDDKLKGKFGNVGTMADAGMHKIVDGLIKKLEDEDAKAQKSFMAMSVAGAQSVQAWAPVVSAALALDGDPQSWVAPLLVTMSKESAGNPNAVNNYDINAQNGTPSMGLMQVIGPTFSAYCMPGYCANILDPLSNILAAIRYIKAVYGVPTGKSPYAQGTNNATRGWHLVGEHGPEMAWFGGGEKVWNAHKTRGFFGGVNGGGGGPVVVNVENHWHGNPTKEAVQYAESGMANKLRQACEAGVGRRAH